MRRSNRVLGVRIATALLFCTSVACATGGQPPDPSGSSEPVSSDPTVDGATGEPQPPPTSSQTGPGNPIGARAESAMEGLIIGTVIGGQIAGSYGAAAGAALFGLYGLITGDVPLQGGRSPSSRRGRPSDDDLEREIEDELSNQAELEDEIEEELRRQEELLAAINREESIEESIRKEEVQQLEREGTGDPLSAPRLPHERQLPETIYDVEVREDQIHKTLDADRDGHPEIEIIVDKRSGQTKSRAEDTDYDGLLDVHNSYSKGELVLRTEDTNGDGMPDRWTHYKNGQGTLVEVDRDFDGTKDGFHAYDGGVLVYEEHDTDNDGKVDRRVEYTNRRRAVEMEDRDGDGTMDFRTFFDANEVPERTEADSDGDGKTDVWEYYEGDQSAHVVLVRKTEDLNSDGDVDVTSFYENGKLIRKEVSDPDLLEP